MGRTARGSRRKRSLAGGRAQRGLNLFIVHFGTKIGVARVPGRLTREY